MAQPTVLDELDESLALGSCEDLGGNDAQSSQPTEGDMPELLIHKRQPPEGETILTLPDLQQPLQKKQKLEEPKLPSAFRVKWVLTNTGLVPFVMNMDMGILSSVGATATYCSGTTILGETSGALA